MIDLNRSRNLGAHPRASCFLVLFMVAGLLAGRATAQTFTTLHSFTALDTNIFTTNSDGTGPNGLIILSNTLYGTAFRGGRGFGTVFKFNTDGTGFTNLHSLAGTDGVGPSSLIVSDKTLYGTAFAGGSGSDLGTMFKVNTDGTGFTKLHTFNGSDGAYAHVALLLSGNTLYGTASNAGSNRRLEFELGAGFEGSCGFALVLALSQMREHGLGPFGRADLYPRRNPFDRQGRFAPQPGSDGQLGGGAV